ncbi:hypothetical protein OC846_002172 [Tilletia horrida]|uniref:THH1/TOM1/TOM3 domain-containing protein n=1 Tax=Tilletia horrida TaxID=155126 RepID=A0AAN6GUP8_9BASI|nr:hypothetical protein OC845_004256 [Tilletia horrida]KAK0554289.1 hypothetical protein OC846_002172 [Tilletia horrida]KAK0563380.1 hypothetical protein OC861_004829 [Tilletia horrida]
MSASAPLLLGATSSWFSPLGPSNSSSISANHTSITHHHPSPGSLSADEIRERLSTAGNVLGGVPTARDIAPSIAMLILYILLVIYLGARWFLRRLQGAVDLRVFGLLALRIATFVSRLNLAEEDADNVDRSLLAQEDFFMLLGPLLIVSSLLTIIGTIATPTLDALKARALWEGTAAGHRRKSDDFSRLLLQNVPQIFQAVLSVLGILTCAHFYLVRRVLRGHQDVDIACKIVEGITSVALVYISLSSIMMIIGLWTKVLSTTDVQFLVSAQGQSRQSKSFKVQTLMVSLIAVITFMLCMYRVVAGFAGVEDRINSFTAFWLAYVAPEAAVALFFTVYCFPQMLAQEIVLHQPVSGGEANTNANVGTFRSQAGERSPSPPMRAMSRSASVRSDPKRHSAASTSTMCSDRSIQYIKA